MGEYTTRAGMYLPGGGSTGLILPDETVDIDKINSNFRIIDKLLGARNVPSASSYVGAMDGDLVYSQDTGLLKMYSADAGQLVDPRVGGSIPVGGSITYYGSETLDPLLWLPEDGSAVSRTTYLDLFNVIGTTFGVGDGSTTFNVPDSRGRAQVAIHPTETEWDELGKKYGSRTHVLTEAQLARHTHTVYYLSPALGSGGTARWIVGTPTSNVGGTTSGTSGNNEPHNNVQPSIAVHRYIKT